MDIAKTYSKLRSSTGFLVSLVLFIVLWLMLSSITGFDKDHGLINLMLSAEASVSLAFFSMLQDRVERATKLQMDIMEQLLKKMNERDEKLMEIVEDIHEEVDQGGN